MKLWESVSLLFLLLYNAVVMSVFGFDKQQARRAAKKKKSSRVSEKSLLLLAACFGGAGAMAGMQVYRHKTKKKIFRVLVPLFMGVQLALLAAYAVWRIWF